MSRTMIIGWVMSALGLLGVLGVDLPLDRLEELLTLIFDSAFEAFAIINGALMIWMRKVTDSPVATGIRGLLGMKGEKNE